jgi:hypothetical protein
MEIDKCVDSNLVSWSKVILLHGPPGTFNIFSLLGTGKTSLCKALAQVINLHVQ